MIEAITVMQQHVGVHSKYMSATDNKIVNK